MSIEETADEHEADAPREEGADSNPDPDRVELICIDCEGPIRYWEDEEGAHHACMCSDPVSSIIDRMGCRRCGESVEFDENRQENPMNCGCPEDSKPDAYRMMSKQESIDRARDFL